jgi:ribonuclease HI
MNGSETRPLAVAYGDGGCFPNPGRAGWAAVLVTGEGTRELLGGEENSTNQRAEVLAAIAALEALDAPAEVEIVSDSMYLAMCGSGQWKRKTNRDLWARLDKASTPHVVRFAWVRGHAGNPGNERAHELAQRAIERGAA